MGYRENTRCVQPADYVDPLPRNNNAIQTIGAVLDGLILGGYLPDAILGCDYLLGGKLVCLGGDQCAIGYITHFEPASEKSFPANLDNDFSFNILLSPDGLGTYAAIYKDTSIADQAKWQKAFGTASAATKPQGDLLKQQDGMPIPHEDEPDDKRLSDQFSGYYSEYPDANYPEFDPSHSPFQVPGSDGPAFRAPALHLEAEGDRICNVCAVISAFTLGPVGKAICKAKFLGIPVGSIACHIIGFFLLPFLPAVLVALLAAIGVAWAASRDGNQDDPRTDTQGGELHLGDLVVVTGRWVYDAGHTGWNELHPLKTVQKIDPKALPDKVADQRARWCGLLAQVPPFVPPGPGTTPTGMTPGQTGVWISQRQPEHQWYLHPAIDGCRPGEPDLR
jgi:hypothetical protein